MGCDAGYFGKSDIDVSDELLYQISWCHIPGWTNVHASCFGGLHVACWPLVPKFAGSHPAEAVGFLGRKKKSSACLPSEGK